MTTILNDFGLFIDDLRKKRNMSRENFINGIISIRQYQRYVNGESSLNNEKLFKLIDRLGMNFFNIHQFYLRKNNEHKSKLNKIYGEISRENIKLASELIDSISTDDFFDEYNKSFYELCKLLLFTRTKKMPSTLVVDKFKKLINYPDCLKNDIISFVEYVAYIEISTYSNHSEDTRIVNYLYSKIKDNIISLDSTLIPYLPSAYAHVSRRFGVIEEFQKSLIIAQQGIDWCLRYDSFNSLAHLFYYKALSLSNLNRREESLVTVRKLFSLLSVANNKNKTIMFTKVFEKDFNMKVSEL